MSLKARQEILLIAFSHRDRLTQHGLFGAVGLCRHVTVAIHNVTQYYATDFHRMSCRSITLIAVGGIRRLALLVHAVKQSTTRGYTGRVTDVTSPHHFHTFARRFETKRPSSSVRSPSAFIRKY